MKKQSFAFRIRRNRQIHEKWISGAKLVTLAQEYGSDASTISDRVADHQTVLIELGLPVPKRQKTSNYQHTP